MSSESQGDKPDMKLTWIAVLTIAGAVAFAQPAAPQTPPSPDELKTALGLSDAQVTALQQLEGQKRTQIQPVGQQLADKQKALHDALEKATPDANAIAAILIQIQSLQNQIKTINTSFQTQATATLTADQKTKLQALQTAQALREAVQQAEGLNLLARPEEPAAGGPGPRRVAGPQGPPAFGQSFFRRR